MFNIDSNSKITISVGDTAEFPIILNSGTALSPVHKKFAVNQILSINTSSATIKGLSIDVYAFFNKLPSTGVYIFTYTSASVWQLSAKTIEPADYGIIFTGIPVAGDTITVSAAAASDDYIEFYIRIINSAHVPICKTIKPNGTISTVYTNDDESTTESTTGNTTVDGDGNMLITIQEKDTTFLPAGEYSYYVKLYKKLPSGSYDISTITPQYKFILTNP